MPKTKTIRPSANDTRNKILKTALRLFMQHGFAGTSMGKLAEAADVNQSLISHHFGDKEQLWQQAKAAVVADIDVAPINPHPKSLADFLADAVGQRLSIYAKRPELIRLVSWQRLEPTKKSRQLHGIPDSALSPEKWLVPMEYLQQKGLLRKDIHTELMLTWIITSVNGLIMDDLNLFKNHPQNQKHYTDMIVTGLTKALEP